MPEDRTSSEESDPGPASEAESDRPSAPPADDPTDTIDVEHTDRVRVGVTRGERDLELGAPRDYPDRADVSVRPVSDDGQRIVLSIDAMAGDHGTGHADVELTIEEARTLRARLDETVRWMSDDPARDADANDDAADASNEGDPRSGPGPE